jgi:hypothetical protein
MRRAAAIGTMRVTLEESDEVVSIIPPEISESHLWQRESVTRSSYGSQGEDSDSEGPTEYQQGDNGDQVLPHAVKGPSEFFKIWVIVVHGPTLIIPSTARSEESP